MWGTVQYDGNMSEHFKICNGVKQGCLLAPTIFDIFFSLLLKHDFDTAEEDTCIHDLKAKRKIKYSFIKA